MVHWTPTLGALMPLPQEKTAWPPLADASRYDRMVVHSIWYECDPDKLSNQYKGGHLETVQDTSTGPGLKGKLYRVVHRWFWGTDPGKGEKDTKIHIPIAQDIATLS